MSARILHTIELLEKNPQKCFVLGFVVILFLYSSQYSYRHRILRNTVLPSDLTLLKVKKLWITALDKVFIFKSPDKKKYKAFCAGSIIGNSKVLSSANCFLTNRKRVRVPLREIKVAAGILVTVAEETKSDDVQQWRGIKKVYSQRFYKFPAYNLAVLMTTDPFLFNKYVNKIPYAAKNLDFDGVCVSTILKPSASWAAIKTLHSEQLQMITRRECETTLLRSCKLFYCTAYKTRYIFGEIEGGGLICHHTGDSEEKYTDQGILVGVTSLIHVDLPTLHNRVAIFHRWITDGATRQIYTVAVFYVVLLTFTYA